LNDKSLKTIKNMEKQYKDDFKAHFDDLSDILDETIKESEDLIKNTQNRSESFWGRKKWIDILVILNLSVIPIVVGVIVYILWFKI